MIRNRRDYDAAAIRMEFLEEKEKSCGISRPEAIELHDLYYQMDEFDGGSPAEQFQDRKIRYD